MLGVKGSHTIKACIDRPWISGTAEQVAQALPPPAEAFFHVHGVDRHDRIQWQGKYSCQKWLDALAQRVPAGAEIGMVACASSHHWVRELQQRGYHVRLIAA